MALLHKSFFFSCSACRQKLYLNYQEVPAMWAKGFPSSDCSPCGNSGQSGDAET